MVDIEAGDLSLLSAYEYQMHLSSLEPRDTLKDLIGPRAASTMVVQH